MGRCVLNHSLFYSFLLLLLLLFIKYRVKHFGKTEQKSRGKIEEKSRDRFEIRGIKNILFFVLLFFFFYFFPATKNAYNSYFMNFILNMK